MQSCVPLGPGKFHVVVLVFTAVSCQQYCIHGVQWSKKNTNTRKYSHKQWKFTVPVVVLPSTPHYLDLLTKEVQPSQRRNNKTYCCTSVRLRTSFCFSQQSSTTNLLVLSFFGPAVSPKDLLCSISLSICSFFASEMKRLRGFLSCLQRQENNDISLQWLVCHRSVMRPSFIMLWFCFLSQ